MVRPVARAVLLAVLLVAISAAPVGAATVPAGFTDEQVLRVAAPTALAFLPDGRMLVATQPGVLRLRDAGGRVSDALDLRGRICSNSERGLLGVAVDPDFASNRHVYAYYTFNRNGSCATRSADAPVNRVARFVLADDGVARAETVLIDNIPSFAGNHNAGDLAFGRDGLLYVTVGDGGCNFARPDACGGANDAAREPSTLLGKVLRIDRNGVAPDENGGGDVCAAAGRTSAGRRCRETFASGLRNPFRFAFDPNAETTRFFVNDVGQSRWEEIDEGRAGADYGWNEREGPCRTGSTTDCPPPRAGLTDPVFAYQHNSGCGSITGGAFVPNGAWPAAYDSAYLYSDYVCGTIFRLSPRPGGWSSTPMVTGLGASSAVHLAFGPGPRGPALHYTSYAGGGEVRRLYSNEGGNGVPTARLEARPASGAVPLTVALDGTGSSDPERDALTYQWEFGDGTTTTSGDARVTHTYRQERRYTASLRVRDARGALSAAATAVIDAGNDPPRGVIESSTGSVYEFGERIRMVGTARDPQDGLLPASALSWNVVLHHESHTHPFLGPLGGRELSLKAPLPEDRDAVRNTHLSVELNSTDSRGLARTVTFRLRPRRSLAALDAALSARRFSAGALPERVRRGRRGRPSELRVRLSARARLRLARERAVAGRRAGRRCTAPSRRNRDGRRCVLWADVEGTYAQTLPRGSSTLRFSGRLVRGERVAAGRYRLVVRAQDAYGRRSPVQRIAYAVR